MVEKSGRPAYEQVADDLRQKIVDGTYPVGEALPSTQRLMDSYSVSSTVARRAVSELRNEGLVVGQSGKAVFVKRVPDSQPAPSPEFTAIMQRVDELKATVDGTMADLDRRLQEVEKAVRAAERPPRRER